MAKRAAEFSIPPLRRGRRLPLPLLPPGFQSGLLLLLLLGLLIVGLLIVGLLIVGSPPIVGLLLLLDVGLRLLGLLLWHWRPTRWCRRRRGRCDRRPPLARAHATASRGDDRGHTAEGNVELEQEPVHIDVAAR
jgi:hypothetical protein